MSFLQLYAVIPLKLTGYGPRILKNGWQYSKVDYPAWSTKFTAFMQTKGLYKSLVGKEIIPQEIASFDEDAPEEQTAQRNAQVQQRNKEIEDIN